MPAAQDTGAKDALVSPCGAYRYWLTRRWAPGPLLPIVMLNPSVADAEQDDPTIRRCVGLAKREGFSGIRVKNLYAFRATKPNVMFRAQDPVGPDNEGHLDEMLAEAALEDQWVWCAWGSAFEARPRANRLAVRAKFIGARLMCVGILKDGQPRHPLYMSNDAQLEKWPR